MSAATKRNDTNVDPRGIKKSHVEQAYDIVAAGHGEENASSAVQDALHRIGYRLADNVPQILSNHERNKRVHEVEDTNSSTADETALAIAEIAFESGTIQTETDGTMTDAMTEAARESAEETVESTTEKTVEDGTGNTVSGADATDGNGFVPSGLGSLYISNTGRIDRALRQTLRNARSVQDVLDRIDAAEKSVAEHDAAIAKADEALRLHGDGDHDAAAAIQVPSPTAPRTSGLVVNLDDGSIDEEDLSLVDMALEKQTNGTVQTYRELNDALARAEEASHERAKTLRERRRALRKAAPSEKLPKSSDEDPASAVGADVVMRNASEIFTDTYGTSSPILDFEVPTLEWSERHPDVPDPDTTYKFYAPVLATVLFCIKKGKIPWLMGDTGSGKSQLYEQIAARLGFPFVRVNMDSHLTRSDIVGTTKLIADDNGRTVTQFIDGLVPYALRMPCILLIDELDLGDPEIMPVIQPVLEGKGIRLLEDRGRHVHQNPYCFIGCTGNTNGLGDGGQTYLNAHEQSGATRDRIAYYIEMPYLPEDEEFDVVTRRVPGADEEFTRKMIQLANKTRESYRLGEIGQLVSTRHVVDAVEMHEHFAQLWNDHQETEYDVLEKVVLNFMDDHSRAVIKNVADGIFG